MYSTGSCPYCVRAKQLLDRKGVTVTTVRIDEHPDRRDEMLQRSEGRRTVPQIFIDDFHVGGFDDMVELDMEGRLDTLLGLK
jgi:glutaredoxin 3